MSMSEYFLFYSVSIFVTSSHGGDFFRDACPDLFDESFLRVFEAILTSLLAGDRGENAEESSGKRSAVRGFRFSLLVMCFKLVSFFSVFFLLALSCAVGVQASISMCI